MTAKHKKLWQNKIYRRSRVKGLHVGIERCTAEQGVWRAAEVNKEDKEKREVERESWVLSVISGSRADGCPGTAWHKQQQQQGPIFSHSHISEGTIHHTSG